MSTPETTANVPSGPGGPPDLTPAPSGVAVDRGRWTANRSMFDPPEPVDWGRIAKAQGGSLLLHALFVVALIFAVIRAKDVVQQVAKDEMKFDITYLANMPGPGGGGGGNPKPAPPKKIEVPKPTQQNLAPVPVPVEAPPAISAPIMTQPDTALLAAGVNIGGTAEPGSKVTVVWGNTTKTVDANASGSWSATRTGGK